MLKMMEAEDSFQVKTRYTTMKKLQFAIIGRVDNISNLETRDLRGHGVYDFALITKVKWSKNFFEERCCPEQILLGSNDTKFCILLSLSIYLESWMSVGSGQHSRYIFSDNVAEEACNRVKVKYMYKNQKLLTTREFQEVAKKIPGHLGLHSD